jgi:hypothetical protein
MTAFCVVLYTDSGGPFYLRSIDQRKVTWTSQPDYALVRSQDEAEVLRAAVLGREQFEGDVVEVAPAP